MTKEDRQSLATMPIILLIGAALAWAGGQGGSRIGCFPVYALCIGLAFLIQWLAFIPAYWKRTESFFDLTGGITSITVTLIAVLLSRTVDARALLLFGLISIWAIRLASFLFLRIRAAGEDRRFREIKKSFARFLLTWTLQGLWVAFSLAAALAAITTQMRIRLDLYALIGFLVWLIGFSIEVIADKQKNDFKAVPENNAKFINSGLWSWSRHPNYFGEIVLWIGIALITLPILRGPQWLTLISPIFITLLLTKISGIPMLESRADEKWGGQPDYEKYKAGTSVLIPTPPTKQ